MAYDLNALVVDDDDHVRTFLVVLLRKIVSGTVSEARNGLEAIEVFKRDRPELVLLDVNMPMLDGLDALKQIRLLDQEVPVIMVTSLAMRKVVEDSLNAGASNFIRKDTSKPEIMKIVRDTIETYLDTRDPEAPAAPSEQAE